MKVMDISTIQTPGYKYTIIVKRAYERYLLDFAVHLCSVPDNIGFVSTDIRPVSDFDNTCIVCAGMEGTAPFVSCKGFLCLNGAHRQCINMTEVCTDDWLCKFCLNEPSAFLAANANNALPPVGGDGTGKTVPSAIAGCARCPLFDDDDHVWATT